MDAPAALDEGAPPSPRDTDTFAAARAALDQALRVADAALALLRAELRLARSSAFTLIWLGFALVFLGVGAWLATSAAIAAGIYQLTGNIFYGVGSVALANLLGVAAGAVGDARLLARTGSAEYTAHARPDREVQP